MSLTALDCCSIGHTGTELLSSMVAKDSLLGVNLIVELLEVSSREDKSGEDLNAKNAERFVFDGVGGD